MPAWAIAGLTLLALALTILDVRGLLLLFAPLGLLSRRRFFRPTGAPRPLVVPPDLDRTAPPAILADGSAPCSGCDAVVPFDSMSIGEDGYFCPGCARA
jgi:hypothetical protein